MMLKLQHCFFSTALVSKQKTGDKLYVRKLARGEREKKRLRTPGIDRNVFEITKKINSFRSECLKI